MSLLYHVNMYLEFLILACTIYILASTCVLPLLELTRLSNECEEMETTLTVLPLLELTRLSNVFIKNYSVLFVLPLLELTRLSNEEPEKSGAQEFYHYLN